MPIADHLLGIDLGTGGCKALLVAADGAIIATATTSYPLLTPRPLWSEQAPAQWWAATIASIRTVLNVAGIDPAQVAAVGLTGQMHGLVLLNQKGGVLRNAILWNDQRSGAQCEAITRRLGLKRIIDITGKPLLPNFTAPKILWVREHEPQIFRAAATMLLPKDFLRYRLTGALATDVADASGTSLFDVGKRRWSQEILDALDVPHTWLGEVSESPMASSTINKLAAEACGLVEGTPVVAGAGDQAAEAVGCGIVADGQVSVTIGTSGVVFRATDTFRPDPEGRVHAYCHAAPGLWHVMGVMLSAGGSLRWYRQTLGQTETDEGRRRGIDPYDLLLEAAAEVEPGSEGLLFLPYLSGERTPHADPQARGAFVGLTLRHDKPHMTRAVVEGVTFGLKDALELVLGCGGPAARAPVRVSGGGATSGFWRQLMADIFDQEVVTVNATQGAAFGAALLAGVGAGIYRSVPDAAGAVVRQTGSTRPGPHAAAYREHYERYRSLYPALAPVFQSGVRGSGFGVRDVRVSPEP